MQRYIFYITAALTAFAVGVVACLIFALRPTDQSDRAGFGRMKKEWRESKTASANK
jgi:hypothetical protein